MKTMKKITSLIALTGTCFIASQAHAGNIVDTVVDKLCAATERCDAQLNHDDCVIALNGVDGQQIWDGFGVLAENSLSTAQVRKFVQFGVYVVSSTPVKNACLKEIHGLCLRGEEDLIGGDYANVENLIDDGSVCQGLLTSKPVKNKF